jgi:transcriptional regulator with GAF, ATPase, and Fis domain
MRSRAIDALIHRSSVMAAVIRDARKVALYPNPVLILGESGTGAVADRLGRFEAGDGGTLFLDEVRDMPPETPVRLLRVLQEGEIQRVGEARVRKVDVWVMAATL